MLVYHTDQALYNSELVFGPCCKEKGQNERGKKKDVSKMTGRKKSIKCMSETVISSKQKRSEEEEWAGTEVTEGKKWEVLVQGLNEEAFEVSSTLRIQGVLQGNIVLLQIHVLHRLQVDLRISNTTLLSPQNPLCLFIFVSL